MDGNQVALSVKSAGLRYIGELIPTHRGSRPIKLKCLRMVGVKYSLVPSAVRLIHPTAKAPGPPKLRKRLPILWAGSADLRRVIPRLIYPSRGST